jgi:hypothetical protein
MSVLSIKIQLSTVYIVKWFRDVGQLRAVIKDFINKNDLPDRLCQQIELLK